MSLQSSSSSPAADSISARLAALRTTSTSDDIAGDGSSRDATIGASTSLQSGGGELDITPSSARSSSMKSSSGGNVWNEGKSLCVVIDENNISSMCGAHIGQAKGRFCTAKKESGQKHCGTSSHALSTHQVLEVGNIYAPGADNRGKPTALSSPTVHANDIPEDLMAEFLVPHTSMEAVELINQANGRTSPAEAMTAEANKSKLPTGHHEAIVEDASSEGDISGIESVVGRIKKATSPMFYSLGSVDLSYSEDAVVKPEDYALPSLPTKVDLSAYGDDMWKAIEESNAKLGEVVAALGMSHSQAIQAACEVEKGVWTGNVRPPIDPVVDTNLKQLLADRDNWEKAMGDPDALVDVHGSVVNAITDARAKASTANSVASQVQGTVSSLINQFSDVSSSVDLLKASVGSLTSDVGDLDKALATFKVEVTDTITAVTNNYARAMNDIKIRLVGLEGNKSSSVLGPGLSSTTTSSSNVDMDHGFGDTSIDGSVQSITPRWMVNKLVDLERQFKSSNSPGNKGDGGVHFEGIHFDGQATYAVYFTNNNPGGAGPAAFVDIVSIWTHGAQTTSSELTSWLNNLQKSQVTGLSSSQESDFIMSFGTRYPEAFAGTDKIFGATQVLKVFTNVKHWNGHGAGDGAKERLRTQLAFCVSRHADYCHTHVPPGPLLVVALATGQYVQRAVLKLINMFDDQIARLRQLGLNEKFVMILVSHELIHVFDELYKIRQRGVNADVQNKVALAARLSFLTLQALMKLDEFVVQGSSHPVFVGATQEFLMQVMADSSSGSASSAGGVSMAEVETAIAQEARDRRSACSDLEDKLQKQVNKQTSKLNNVIKANNLKVKSGNRGNNSEE